MRRVVEIAIVLSCLGLIGRTWLVQGLLAPCRVAGGSMAPTLLGNHYALECAECGFRFAVGADHPANRFATCSSCGYDQNPIDETAVTGGDGVLVDRSALRLRRPRRWEVVAFRGPDRSSEFYLKRVVGLPGESIEIRDGDIYVSGRIARKTLVEQRATGVLVPPEKPHRPVTDWLAYNQNVPPTQQGELHEVRDLRQSFRIVRLPDDAPLLLHATDGPEKFQVEIRNRADRLQSCRVFWNDQPVEVELASLPDRWENVQVDLSLVDQQFLLALDGKTAAVIPYERDSAADPPRFWFDGEGWEAAVADRRLYRDLYYAPPLGSLAQRGVGRPVQLGDDEYYVLGDNPTVSEDSRFWTEPLAVDSTMLVGKPLLVHLPLRQITIAGFSLQVPAVGRIRWIR